MSHWEGGGRAAGGTSSVCGKVRCVGHRPDGARGGRVWRAGRPGPGGLLSCGRADCECVFVRAAFSLLSRSGCGLQTQNRLIVSQICILVDVSLDPQAIERAQSEVRRAEGAAASLAELCDSLRGDEADLRDRLASLHPRASAAEREAADADASRAAAHEVLSPLPSLPHKAFDEITCYQQAPPRGEQHNLRRAATACTGGLQNFWLTLQALESVQQQAEEANRKATQWGDAAARLRSECASLEAAMREQREAGEHEVQLA